VIAVPRLYPIVDAECFSDSSQLFEFAEQLIHAGCTWLQYRNKTGDARQMLEHARELRRRLHDRRSRPSAKSAEGWGTLTRPEYSHPVAKKATRVGQPWARLIMNDRADLAFIAEFDGVHVGQDDLSPVSARKIIGPDRWLGVSTHNPEQLAEADKTSADYLAIGPVFATSSKERPDPMVGLEGVRRARQLTRKPLVAIGGITRVNAAAVIEAGADSVAVISDLLPDPRKSAEEFLRILR
jgi:thiamine-phosphate pyrophosphorylase